MSVITLLYGTAAVTYSRKSFIAAAGCDSRNLRA